MKLFRSRKDATYTRVGSLSGGYTIRDRLGATSHLTAEVFGLFLDAVAAHNASGGVPITLYDETSRKWMIEKVTS